MSSPAPRSVKIGTDERGGWTSDRPRRPGEEDRPRPVNVAVRSRVLAPSDRVRYSPGSLLLVVSAEPGAPEAFLGRVLEEPGALFGMAKIRALLQGRVPAEELDEKAAALLAGAVAKRMAAGDSVAVPMEDLDPEARVPLVRLAAQHRRPRHLILLETGKDRVPESERERLRELRTALDSAALGEEGFATAMRLGGTSLTELKRIVFAPPPADD